ncbi:MAG TPA: hypothetical protein VJ463_02390 [Geothrix sp.]|nr:hypothetical protein [Geothrix sp.]
MTRHRTLEMTISRPDFLRRLPAAVGEAAVREEEGRFAGGEGARRWTLRLVALPDRELARVVLPCHRVEIGLEGYGDLEAEAFMTRFLRAYQRGGG